MTYSRNTTAGEWLLPQIDRACRPSDGLRRMNTFQNDGRQILKPEICLSSLNSRGTKPWSQSHPSPTTSHLVNASFWSS